MRSRNIRNITIISDLILFNAAFAFAYVVRYRWQWFLPVEEQFFEPYGRYLSQQIAFNALMIFTFIQGRVWRRRRGEFWVDETSRIGFATATAVTLLMAVTYFFISEAPFSRLMLFWILLFVVLFLGLARLLRRWVLSVLYGRGTAVDRVLVLGSGETGRGLIRTLLARPDLGFKAIGYLHDGSQENNIGLGRIPHLGTFADLPRILRESPNLYMVFIALPGEMYHQTTRLLHICQEHGIRAQVVPDLLQLSLNRVEFNNMAGIPMLGVREVGMTRWQRALKRALDLIFIAIAGIPALLLTGVIATAIKLDSSGPILYAADRVGRNGKSFKMYKFRSMVIDADKRKKELEALNEADGPIFKIKDDPRLTRVGKFLRRSSLDELPQLWNVLLGQMSLVGPRPPLQEEVDQYKPWHLQRLAVIGGLT
ncbi:MAG: sugar transferase, partial [Anaerolineae bacterium]